LPYVFTEHGAVMAANVLNSEIAIAASVAVVRVFIRMRVMITEYADHKRNLQALEQRVAKGFADHEDELREVRFLIARLEQPLDTTRKKIGFGRDKEK